MKRTPHTFPFPRVALAVLVAGIVVAAPAPVPAWPGCEVDWFFLSVSGDTVTVDHNAVSYNCCLDHIEWTVDLTGSLLTIFEYEITPEPCTCFCCFELSVSVADCPPGLLDVEFHWADSETGEWETWTDTILVPDVGQTAPPAIASGVASDCLPFGTAAPEPGLQTGPWAGLKAWYRTR